MRVKITIHGAVQGVGFRPFIFRLASELNLKGFVLNSSAGVQIEAEGEKYILDSFVLRIEKEKPKAAIINSLEFSFLDETGYNKFEILKSKDDEEKTTLIVPDIAVCDDCLNEMYDPNDRRYLYPFINCTNCGPRFSIINSLPYDRPNTTMHEFEMCDDCRKEYEDPTNRRFHAQPIACPKCGPHIELWDSSGNLISKNHSTINNAIEKIKEGKIIALKGIGGFQLIVDATDIKAVDELRIRKHREEKPFAVMFPNIESVKEICVVNDFEERLLLSPEAPIVLLKKHINKDIEKIISPSVAPGNPYLGVMLAYSPLHHLLLNELGKPIVATSANISEEPIIIDEHEALNKLKSIADYYLVHNRKIVRHVDDSIVRVILGREMVLRRARGYAPLPIQNNFNSNGNKILAVGGHLKNTIALSVGNNIFSSQHIGDLSTQEAEKTFKDVINDFEKLYEVKSNYIASDLHPDYISTKFAKTKNKNLTQVQHHTAHIAACVAENQIDDEVLGVSWDGTGYGTDGNIWGGEFFTYNKKEIKRVAHFRYFPLPGGESSIKEPRRSALGLLYEIYGNELFIHELKLELLRFFNQQEISILKQALQRKINTPLTSSVGRIFDAVASLLNINQKMSFEGQAAMMLEFNTIENVDEVYPYDCVEDELLIIDYKKTFISIIEDLKNNIDVKIIATKFHNTMAEIICDAAKYFKIEKVVLSGGVFQNAYLLERTVIKLKQYGFKPYWHQRIPTNDGGISVGQIVIAQNILNKK